MSVISLRGTNGAGKSTLVRAIMSLYSHREEMRTTGRRKPIGYRLHGSDLLGNLFIPGHYEIANGGIDTLNSLDEAYELIWEAYDAGFHVLYEGKNMTDGTARLCNMFDKEQAIIVVLDHPIEDCIKSVRDRGHRIQESSIKKVQQKVLNDMVKFVDLGYECYVVKRDTALDQMRSLLANPR